MYAYRDPSAVGDQKWFPQGRIFCPEGNLGPLRAVHGRKGESHKTQILNKFCLCILTAGNKTKKK